MNKVVKTIGVLSIASLVSTSAFSQITISGYAEVGFITYNTFHVAFKNITGLTTQESIKRF